MKLNKLPEELIERYLAGTATADEKALVESWHLHDFSESKSLPSIQKIRKTHQQTRKVIMDHAQAKVKPLWPRIAAAACILLFVASLAYFTFYNRDNQSNKIAGDRPGIFKNDAMPGNKAILTLSNGQQIALAALPEGKISNSSGTGIRKMGNGAIIYSGNNRQDNLGAAPSLIYNTLTVARGGGKHELILADGTLAILDAGSSIRFPIAFTGKDRKVTITGQVYFEVIHNDKQPFYVMANGQTIEDIGTHFNVSTFDEEVKTTLLEGVVKVNDVLLSPGQQAVQKADGKIKVLYHVDPDEVTAWKNDLFRFTKNTSLKTVMNQISRWYDMDVVYKGSAKTYHLAGDMPRYSKLSDLLKILAYSGVQFSVDGKKITVYQ